MNFLAFSTKSVVIIANPDKKNTRFQDNGTFFTGDLLVGRKKMIFAIIDFY